MFHPKSETASHHHFEETTKPSLVVLQLSPSPEESDVIFRDAYVGTLPTKLPPLQWQEFATFCVEWLPACAVPCFFLCKEFIDALFPRSIRFFLLFAAYATFVAMQAVIALNVVIELFQTKVFRTSLFIAYVAFVRAGVLCMVSLCTASLTHQRRSRMSVVLPFLR